MELQSHVYRFIFNGFESQNQNQFKEFKLVSAVLDILFVNAVFCINTVGSKILVNIYVFRDHK